MQRRPRPAAALLLLPLAACSGLGDTIDRLEEIDDQEPGRPDDDLTAAEIRQSTFETIAKLEDAREDGNGYLQILLRRDDPRIRERATVALGRLPLRRFGETVTGPLGLALADPDPGVRAAAAFALGFRKDPAAVDVLLERWDDPDPTVRARICEAASYFDDGRLRARVVEALRDPAVDVRIEAVVGPHRWPEDAPGVEEAESAVARVAGDVEEDPEVVWRALFCLQRRRAEAGRGVFLASATSDRVLERLFAVKGLGRIEPDTACREALERALADDDIRVALEAAAGLGRIAPVSLDGLVGALDHGSFHVRAAAYGALGGFRAEPARVTELLEDGRLDPSASVRSAALVAEAKTRGVLLGPYLEGRKSDHDPGTRASVAAAAAELHAALAVPILIELTGDPDLRVAGTAIAGLARHPGDEAHGRLVELLGADDNGLRLAAVLALREMGRREDVVALAASYREATGDIGPELRTESLRSAAAIGTPEAFALVKSALSDAHPYVRRVAEDVLRENDLEAPPERPTREHDANGLPIAGRDLALDGPNPRIEVVTSKGTLVFELFPREAPVHVYNLLELARQDHYDGLTFHRVVGDFVIQGGCYRGDGNGSRTWRGGALRHEIGPRKYVRGSLGMPRNDDLESGGSQFFVTHRPTPHLDGRYTIFGELREGFEVLDAIEVGDTILDVR